MHGHSFLCSENEGYVVETEVKYSASYDRSQSSSEIFERSNQQLRPETLYCAALFKSKLGYMCPLRNWLMR